MLHKKAQIVVFQKLQNGNSYKLVLFQVSNERGPFWQNITGSIESNEDIDVGARRELLEETTLKTGLINLDLKFEFTDRWNKNVIEHSFYTIISEVDKIKISEEHQDFKILPVNEITEKNFKYKTNFDAFKKACQIIGINHA